MRHEDEKTDIHSKSNQNCVYDAHFWMVGYSKVGRRVTMRNSLPTVLAPVHPKTNFIVNLLWKSNTSLSLYPYTSIRKERLQTSKKSGNTRASRKSEAFNSHSKIDPRSSTFKINLITYHQTFEYADNYINIQLITDQNTADEQPTIANTPIGSTKYYTINHKIRDISEAIISLLHKARLRDRRLGTSSLSCELTPHIALTRIIRTHV